MPTETEVDIVVGLQYGDEAKGKITHHLLSARRYDFVCRASGGPNAGHTIYHNGRKVVTHHIPSGVFFGIPSIIGAGCAINPETLEQEIQDIERTGISGVRENIRIAYNAHIIKPEHVNEDATTDKIGSTKRGIMPVFRDKYARVGLRAEDVPELKDYIIDPVEVVKGSVMIEGAQGLGLCPDHGDYPFVTSSPPTSTYALHSLGLAPQTIRQVWGAAKAYETYVGAKEFQADGETFDLLAEYGEEYGATTGRRRQTNWINMDHLKRSIRINGVTDIVFSKVDVISKVGAFAVLNPNKTFDTFEEMQSYLTDELQSEAQDLNIYWSSSKEEI